MSVTSAAKIGLQLEHFQSNHEGELIDAIHAARERCSGIIINPGAFTHYAWAIHDALATFEGPVIELHISNPASREPWRHTSVVAPVSSGTVAGFGAQGYEIAINAMAGMVKNEKVDVDFDMQGRLSRLIEKFSSAGCESLLVTSLTNIYYLSGFTGSAGLLWVDSKKALLLVDGRYGEQAIEEVEKSGAQIEVEMVGSKQSERLKNHSPRNENCRT